MSGIAWHLEGTVIGACNCDFGCPCNFNAPPTYGHCEGTWTWCVATGAYGATALDGLHFTIAADWPAAIHEGGGVAVAWYDERADDGQREALTALIGGDAGGPWAIFLSTFAFARPAAAARYEVVLDGPRSAVRIRGAGSLAIETEAIRNPVSGAEVHPRIALPEGLVVKELDVLATSDFRVDDAIAYDHSGKYALLGPFAYTGAG